MITLLLTALASLTLAGTSATTGVIHVATNGNDSLPGTNWLSAKRTVNGALAVAIANDEIWIARGAYAERINLGDGRALHGGFSGVVVFITNASSATRLDGLVISGGQAIHGGGIKRIGSGPVIARNTVVGNSAPPNVLGHQGGGLAAMLFTNGLVLANNYVNVPAGSTDVQAEPHLVNVAARDFHLASGSPCIDAGTNTPSTTTDFDGVAWPLDGNTNGVARVDLGAFEFMHPRADTDRDAMLDAAEIFAGTHPTDPFSLLQAVIGLRSTQGRVAVSWTSAVGRIYDLEAATRLAPGADWQTISNNIPANGGRLTVEDAAGSASNRFYRIGVRVGPAASATGLNHPR